MTLTDAAYELYHELAPVLFATAIASGMVTALALWVAGEVRELVLDVIELRRTGRRPVDVAGEWD